jgi:hypothetical protein
MSSSAGVEDSLAQLKVAFRAGLKNKFEPEARHDGGRAGIGVGDRNDLTAKMVKANCGIRVNL